MAAESERLSFLGRVRDAVAEDASRQRVQEAKMRAVAQGVDYEAFRGLVAGAHLASINAPSSKSTSGEHSSRLADPFLLQRTIVRELDGAGRTATASPRACDAKDDGKNDTALLPAWSVAELERAWRAYGPANWGAKYQHLLQLCSKGGLQDIFSRVTSFDCVSEVIKILAERASAESAAAQEVELLLAVSEIDRFELSVAFLSAEEVEGLRRVLAQLEGASRGDTALANKTSRVARRFADALASC